MLIFEIIGQFVALRICMNECTYICCVVSRKSIFRYVFIGWCVGVCSGVARAFPGGRLAHPEGQNEEENK